MGDTPDMRFVLPETRARVGVAAGGAGLVHLAFLILVALAVWVSPDRLVRAIQPEVDPPGVVWIARSDLGGGGGGGGDKMTERQKATDVPAVKPSEPIPTAVAEPAPPPEPVLAAEIPAIPTETPVAVLAAAPTAGPARGPGDAGAGSKGSSGIGPGDHGDGLGPGDRPGTGPGPGLGSGATQPTLVYGPKPRYTAEAMMKGLRGEVHVECESLATGLVGMCRVIKSLDANVFGLDNEALRTAGLFVFEPATRSGEPVASLVRIVLEFNLR